MDEAIRSTAMISASICSRFPLFVALKDWMLLVLVLSALLAALIYWACGEIAFDARRRFVSAAAAAHGSVLLGLFFAVEAWSFDLDRYLLLYGDNGVVVGASYTDIHVALPILMALIALCCVAAIASFANVRLRSARIPLASAALVFGTSFVLLPIATALFQRVYVKPNELQAGIALHRSKYRADARGLQSPEYRRQTFHGGPVAHMPSRFKTIARRSTISDCGIGSRCSTPMRSSRKSAPITNFTMPTSIAICSAARISR